MLRRNVTNTHNIEFTSKCSMWLYLFKSTIRKVVLPTNIKKRVRGEKVSILLRIFFNICARNERVPPHPIKTISFFCQVKDYAETDFSCSLPVEGVTWYSKEHQVHKYKKGFKWAGSYLQISAYLRSTYLLERVNPVAVFKHCWKSRNLLKIDE